MRVILLFLLFLVSHRLLSQSVDTISIKNQLALILEQDQKTRTKGDSVKFMHQIDSLNLVQIEKIISLYGWPGKSFVGRSGNNTVFLAIQHSRLEIQEKYFPLLKASIAENESNPSALALLQDRILIQQGKKQIYGSQIDRDPYEVISEHGFQKTEHCRTTEQIYTRVKTNHEKSNRSNQYDP
ncbi:MAG: DUF6624 domain-containing protein [Ferruginibacter sp.]